MEKQQNQIKKTNDEILKKYRICLINNFIYGMDLGTAGEICKDHLNLKKTQRQLIDKQGLFIK